MKTLLQIRSSIFADNGQSTQLANRFIERWRAANPAGRVIVRDVVAEMIFPAWLLLKCFDKLNADSPHTRIEYYETIIAGTSEMLVAGRADLAITPLIPQGFTGAPLMPLRMLLVAHPEHALHKLGRPLTMRDLRAQRQLIVRETGLLRPTKTMIEARQLGKMWRKTTRAALAPAARLAITKSSPLRTRTLPRTNRANRGR